MRTMACLTRPVLRSRVLASRRTRRVTVSARSAAAVACSGRILASSGAGASDADASDAEVDDAVAAAVALATPPKRESSAEMLSEIFSRIQPRGV